MKKAFVLSSGGLDSTTALAMAVKDYGKENVISASIYYGQKHDKELECAKKVAEYYGVKHIEQDVSTVMQYAGNVCSLVKDSKSEIIDKSYKEQIDENGEGRVETYVPFRNGLFLSIAASIADSLWPGQKVDIYYGAHADDAAGEAYADCSPKFVSQMNDAINTGTYNNISVFAPFISINKSQIVQKGLELNVPYELTWSCYHGREKACGKCGTCIDRLEAFKQNNVKDPIEYEED